MFRLLLVLCLLTVLSAQAQKSQSDTTRNQGEEGFAVGLFVEGVIAVATHAKILNLGSDVEKALGPEKVTVLWTRQTFGNVQVVIEFRV